METCRRNSAGRVVSDSTAGIEIAQSEDGIRHPMRFNTVKNFAVFGSCFDVVVLKVVTHARMVVDFSVSPKQDRPERAIFSVSHTASQSDSASFIPVANESVPDIALMVLVWYTFVEKVDVCPSSDVVRIHGIFWRQTVDTNDNVAALNLGAIARTSDPFTTTNDGARAFLEGLV